MTSDSKKKKNFKIWFSPRSRKIRCCVEKPVAVNHSNGDQRKKNTTVLSEPKDMSVYNFSSSSQDSDSSTPPRRKVNKKAKSKRLIPASSAQTAVTLSQMKRECKRLKLEAINHRWGIGTESDLDSKDEDDEKESSGDDNIRPGKRVSFQCLGSQPEEHQKIISQGETQVDSPDERFEHIETNCLDHLPNIQEPPQQSPSEALKRAGEGTPKISRTTPRWRISREGTAQFPTEDPTSRQSEEDQNVKKVLPMSGRGSTATPVLGRKSTRVRSNRGSPAYMKRNHKGETPLHLASIKGDVEEVRKLLAQGADPNLKDNAGWTPLHEACNLGHLGVVEELLQQGALLNTPGYQNDSPLHDAVRNGHVAVVKLLVERGASQTVLNMFGLRPVDYALTPEMENVLKRAPEAPDPVTVALGLSDTLCKSSGCARETGGPMVLIGSQLSQTQRTQLAKAARLLGGKPVECFSNAVTHVVVPDVSSLPSTLTTRLGILNGCWVLHFNWVCCSLQAGSWAEESMYETGEGPLRARVNRDSLLPPLFDGCFFYLMGSFHKPPKTELLQLIKDGGGQLLNRQPKPDSDVTQTLSAAAYHAQPGTDQILCTQYILYDPQSSYKPSKVRVGKVWSATSTWLLDCIAAFQLLPVPEP
nr:BRCA1-associated RING domain protein 1 isoform X1 [Misgurnus anguillicaudatus]XP_055071955.1 BRCA1-associated RING domain protein 1 isoform X1 [Misgurnus anguillicaudatus]XP_055071956.1 BRCA1-associated RING domain protein 1 isoform X1 [Misgurnus anguillicaudatus]XP_055071957.1 BRCA1-associated RING domain protein 1 isoform X1 [Misgurnus anguillicaudatus]XP_055071958.1 BRCA1-associated RING domain protein 1 isoform X1 [Misgurnus anguillicaudatus]